MAPEAAKQTPKQTPPHPFLLISPKMKLFRSRCDIWQKQTWLHLFAQQHDVSITLSSSFHSKTIGDCGPLPDEADTVVVDFSCTL